MIGRFTAALLFAFAAVAAVPVAADEHADMDAILKLMQELSQHGRDVMRREARLVDIGDVSMSGLKDDLRLACPTAHKCMRLDGLSDDEARLAMYLLVGERSAKELEGTIKGLEYKLDHPKEKEARDRMEERHREMESQIETLKDRQKQVTDAINDILNAHNEAAQKLIRGMH